MPSKRPWDQLRQGLAGELVVLEALEQRYAQQLFDASRDPRVCRWYLGEVPDREQFDHWFVQPDRTLLHSSANEHPGAGDIAPELRGRGARAWRSGDVDFRPAYSKSRVMK
jgi:hypothetical protein